MALFNEGTFIPHQLSSTFPFVSSNYSSPISTISKSFFNFSSNFSFECDKNNVLNLKATELRLGLPGLGQDLEENPMKNNPTKNYVSRAKRGFSDVNFDGSVKWGGPEGDLGSSSSTSPSATSVLFKINGGLESKQTHQSVSIYVEDKKKASSSENGRALPASK